MITSTMTTDGIIPVEWKSSNICLTYEKGSKNDVANNRPICLTSVACKILERILKANILQYLKKLPFEVTPSMSSCLDVRALPT